MFILSAEHGLKGADEIYGPYDQIMDEQRAKELVPSVSEKLEPYDYVVFFRGGARETYLKCIKDACEIISKPLISLGFAFMGGINDLPKVISIIKKSTWDEITNFPHVELHNF